MSFPLHYRWLLLPAALVPCMQILVLDPWGTLVRELSARFYAISACLLESLIDYPDDLKVIGEL
ncbi:hypothetical protein SLEP1_g42757 [Rubroshorea leprosula]|uniref:Uncharacterized protein n=1 Tax=Rubroshorea leprosula TaxID=152421 RepID=A0AAV5LB41_9ROSI|nr:hypothetical protein SLEP1_g42757 [Rubroshorea leprosula]